MDRLLFRLFLSAFLLLITKSVYSKERIVLDNPGANGKCLTFETVVSTPESYQVKIKIHSLEDFPIFRNGKPFHKIGFDDAIFIQKVGEPALPMILQHLGIPNGANYKVEIKELEWKDIDIGSIIPAQPQLLGNLSDEIFHESKEIYNSNYYDYPILDESDAMVWRGIKNVYVKICPFKYYPAEGKLSVLTESMLNVTFISDIEKAQSMPFVSEEDVNIFDNKGFYPKNKDVAYMNNYSARSVDPYDLLIVAGSSTIANSDAMARFCRWKAMKGIRTNVVTTSTTGSNCTSLKSYINQEYNNGMRYVLFVGDTDLIPLAQVDGRCNNIDHLTIKGDYWYGCLDGDTDIQAEVPIGRFPTNDITELDRMVNKTIFYESEDHDWTDKVLMVAHWENYLEYQSTCENICDASYTFPTTFYKAYGASVSDGGNEAKNADVINYINNGVNIVNYNGHGDSLQWYRWSYHKDFTQQECFGQNQLDSLEENVCPIFFSSGCINGHIGGTVPSILEFFLRSTKGATAYYAGTTLVHTFPANEYQKKLFNKILKQYNNRIGDLNLIANIANFGSGDFAIENAFMQICGGDPTLAIWAGTQYKYTNVSLTPVANGIEISTPMNSISTINVVSEDGSLSSKYTCNSSSYTIPTPTDNCFIVLDRTNYVPYVLYYDVDSHYIQNETITNDAYYHAYPIAIGYDVTTSQSYGPVTVESGNGLFINNSQGVTIKNDFECKKGAVLEIK